MPTAPAASAAAASPGCSMLASSSTRWPSSVTAGRWRRRASPARLWSRLPLERAVFLDHRRRGVDDDHAGVAVDDDPVVLADQPARLARADDRRDVHAARDDRGVRGLAADVGDEAEEDAALELQHVGRRDVARDEDERVARRSARGVTAWLASGDAPSAPRASTPSRRSTTCSRSALRSRRYSSSISSNWRASTSSCADSAHSAL